jgi:hypothetical protein
MDTNSPCSVLPFSLFFVHLFGPCPQGLLLMIRELFWLPCWYPFVGLGLHFGTLLVALGSILAHWCCMSMLPSFLCMDFAPQPNLANLVFEQHFGVLCLKTKFLCFHKHIVFRCVSFFFCQHCLSWFLMRFGIDVGSLLGAFSKNIPFFFGWTSKLISDNI